MILHQTISGTPLEIINRIDMARFTEPIREIIIAGANGQIFELVMEKYPFGFETIRVLDEFGDITNLIIHWRKGKKSHRIEIRYSTQVVRVASESLANAVCEAIFQASYAFILKPKAIFLEETRLG